MQAEYTDSTLWCKIILLKTEHWIPVFLNKMPKEINPKALNQNWY